MESTDCLLKVSFSVMVIQTTTKERILGAVRNLPADATADDAIETIVFIAKVEEVFLNLMRESQCRTRK